MSSNIILLGWSRTNLGCEHGCSNLVIDINRYLKAQIQCGGIKSYQVLFPNVAGAYMNGYFIIYGDKFQLDTFSETKEWKKLLTLASFYLNQLTVVRGVENEEVMERMNIWSDSPMVKIDDDNSVYEKKSDFH